MDPARTYRYLTLSRARVLDWVRPLTPEQYTREFEIGPGSIAKALNHLLISEWYYLLRMRRREVPPIAQIIERDEHPPAFPDLEAAWLAQADETREALGAITDWDAPLEYTVERDGRPVRVRTTPADIFTQLALHEAHHRAQVLNMLRHLGVKTEDIDYNVLMYTFTDA